MRRLCLAALFAVLTTASGCGDGAVGEGGVCTSSAECASGLVCDYGQSPHRCGPTSNTFSDLATPARDLHVEDDLGVPDDLAGADLAGADLATPDLSTGADLAKPAQDLAQPDFAQPDLAQPDLLTPEDLTTED